MASTSSLQGRGDRCDNTCLAPPPPPHTPPPGRCEAARLCLTRRCYIVVTFGASRESARDGESLHSMLIPEFIFLFQL